MQKKVERPSCDTENITFEVNILEEKFTLVIFLLNLLLLYLIIDYLHTNSRVLWRTMNIYDPIHFSPTLFEKPFSHKYCPQKGHSCRQPYILYMV